jgi:hypothetical protein
VWPDTGGWRAVGPEQEEPTVWTPKRIVLLTVGFVVFFLSYAGYSSLLGGIDGLPPLPDCYLSKIEDIGDIPAPRVIQKHALIEDKIKQAFGPNCDELNHVIKLDLHARRAVLTAQVFQFEPDGRVLLSPLSLALFGADKGDGHEVEINTLCANKAYLKFDRPISNLAEIGNRKIVEAELYDRIRVTNNHRTPRPRRRPARLYQPRPGLLPGGDAPHLDKGRRLRQGRPEQAQADRNPRSHDGHGTAYRRTREQTGDAGQDQGREHNGRQEHRAPFRR